jgi:hypothetical protein
MICSYGIQWLFSDSSNYSYHLASLYGIGRGGCHGQRWDGWFKGEIFSRVSPLSFQQLYNIIIISLLLTIYTWSLFQYLYTFIHLFILVWIQLISVLDSSWKGTQPNGQDHLLSFHHTTLIVLLPNKESRICLSISTKEHFLSPMSFCLPSSSLLLPSYTLHSLVLSILSLLLIYYLLYNKLL